MNAHVVLRRLALAAALFAVLAAAAPPAHAQSPRGLNSNLRLVVYGGGALQDVRSPFVWVTTAPLVSNVTGGDAGTFGRYSNGNFTAEVNYGNLHVYGSGAAQSSPGNGDFLSLGAWFGGAAQAEYQDRIYVTSPTLPIGTPVTLQFEQDLTGSSNVVDGNPSNDVSANLAAHGPGWSVYLGPAGIGTTSSTHGAAVGDSIDVHGQLFVNLAANNMASGTPPYDGSIACDLVATFPITSLTLGVVLSSNSQTLGVPEAPRTAAFALAGAVPNPARSGALSIRFALPSDAPATLALYDLAGRAVASEAVGALGAGSHLVDLTHGRALAPGVYLARLTQAGAVRTARVAVVR